MPGTDFEMPPFDFNFNNDFDNDFEHDFGTPLVSPIESVELQGSEQRTPESSGNGANISPSLCIITRKLRLRKGRLMKLTEDTIEDLDVLPGAYWKGTLKSKLASEVQQRVPEPQYQHNDTIITVSTSKRGVQAFEKPFGKLEINWAVIDNKLRSWSNPQARYCRAVCEQDYTVGR